MVILPANFRKNARGFPGKSTETADGNDLYLEFYQGAEKGRKGGRVAVFAYRDHRKIVGSRNARRKRGLLDRLFQHPAK
jgi:hypothetical protein